MFVQWKKANTGQPVPLAMFATAMNALLWLWTSAGVALEVLFQLIPFSLVGSIRLIRVCPEPYLPGLYIPSFIFG